MGGQACWGLNMPKSSLGTGFSWNNCESKHLLMQKHRKNCITTICLLAYFYIYIIINNICIYNKSIYIYIYIYLYFTLNIQIMSIFCMCCPCLFLKVRFVAKLLQKVIQYWQHVPKRMWTLSRTTCIGWLGVFLRSWVEVRKGLLYQPSLIYGWDQDTINGLYLFNRGYSCFHGLKAPECSETLSAWAQCRWRLPCIDSPICCTSNWGGKRHLYIYIYVFT